MIAPLVGALYVLVTISNLFSTKSMLRTVPEDQDAILCAPILKLNHAECVLVSIGRNGSHHQPARATKSINHYRFGFSKRGDKYRPNVLFVYLCLLLSGDVELNPGPTYKYPCVRCEKPVRRNQKGIQCDICDRWYHSNCVPISDAEYSRLSNCDDVFICALCSLPCLSESFFTCSSSSSSPSPPPPPSPLSSSLPSPPSLSLSSLPSMSLSSSSVHAPSNTQSPSYIATRNLSFNPSSQQTGLHIVHVNIRSLLPHLDELKLTILKLNPDVIAVSETWLDHSVMDSEIEIDGYQALRYDRNRHGGGVIIYSRNSYQATKNLNISANGSYVETIWTELNHKSFPFPLLLGCFYRPPSTPLTSVNQLFSEIETALSCYRNVILCGDANINVSDCSNHPMKNHLMELINSYHLYQPLTTPTRITSSTSTIIDLFLISNRNLVSSAGTLNVAIADHLMTFVTLTWKRPKNVSTLITRRSFKKFDILSFQEDLQQLPWSVVETFDSPDDKLDTFEKLFNDCLDIHAPWKTFRSKRKSPPWISATLRKTIEKKNRLLARFRRSSSPADWTLYKKERNQVTRLLRDSKRTYFSTLISKGTSPSYLWKAIKSAVPSSTTNWKSFQCDSLSLANKFNRHFVSISCSTTPPQSITHPPSYTIQPPSHTAMTPPKSVTYPPSHTILTPSHTTITPPRSVTHPTSPSHTIQTTSSITCLHLKPISTEACLDVIRSLNTNKSTGSDNIPPSILKPVGPIVAQPLTDIINSSLLSSNFPKEWKLARVKPLHKGGEKHLLTNYRPISLLPTCSKVIERVVHTQLTDHLDANNLVYPHQSGFRPKHSTATTLLKITNDWHQALDSGLLVGVLYLDVSKAFDTVDHSLLLKKLGQVGVSPPSVEWFRSYLSDRSQFTIIDNTKSEPDTTLAGVPQGSILGPTLFAIHVNDLPLSCPTDASTILFADDTTIYTTGTSVQQIRSTLISALTSCNNWMTDNKLRLNLSKTKCMLIHSSKLNPPPLDISLDSTSVEQVSTFKLLGCIIDHHLTWNSHIQYISSKVSRSINLLRRLSWFLPRSALQMYYQTYILPSLDYCDVVWTNCPLKLSTKLERLQNFAGRIILKVPKQTSATWVRKELGWSTLTARRKLHVATLMFKLKNKLAPVYLSAIMTPSSHLHQHNTRYAATDCFHLPQASTNHGKDAFSFTGPKVWNSLPAEARQMNSLHGFTTFVRTYLNSIC